MGSFYRIHIIMNYGYSLLTSINKYFIWFHWINQSVFQVINQSIMTIVSYITIQFEQK